jgi:Replication-relaxation
MMTDRQCRYARRAAPPPLVLTPRDLAIIVACWEHRWLTRLQLQALLGTPGVTRMNQRLRRLYDHGYLERRRTGTVGGGLQPIYLAGRQSTPFLAAQMDRPEAAIRERLREDARASAVMLPHDLQVNDLRIALTAAIRRRGELDGWLNAAECFDPFAPNHSLRPDGYFRFWRDPVLYAFFLEVDRGTASLGRWQAKVARYLDYRESGAYTRRYELSRFRVLTTAPSPARLAHLVAATRERTDRGFWFALTEAVLKDDALEAPIWQSVNEPAPRAFLTL